VQVLGQPAGSPPLRSRVGYVTQAPSVYGDLTVRENLGYFGRILGVGPERIDEVIDEVDLRPQAGQRVDRLPGGQRARGSLATALLSITMLRERTTGTLERLMTMPLAKLDLLAGYAGAFALLAAAQAVIVSTVAFWALDLHVAGAKWAVLLLAIGNAVLGSSLDLFVSAFARTEFQAVQFLPAFVFPQLLLCGLLAPRDHMARVLEIVSWGVPLTYAYDALDGRRARSTGRGSAPTWRSCSG
jgi:ABC-2 type transporter/ABC transporter